MRKRLHLRLMYTILILLSISCTMTSLFSGPKAPESDPVSTWIAETLVAGGFQVTETLVAEATDTPISPNEPTAQPTLMETTPEVKATEAAIENPPPAGFDTSLLRVAYAYGGKLRLWTEGGTEIVLYSGESVADVLLSVDGWVVVFTTCDAEYAFTGLWRVNADGSDLRQLLDAADLLSFSTDPSAEGVTPHQMEFLPETRWLAFNTRLFFNGPGLIIQDDLHLVSATSGEMRTVVPAGQGGSFTYSPDGTRVALVTPTGVSLANADGSALRANLITFPTIMTYSEYHYYPQVSWEEDGSAFWVVVPSEDSLAPDASMAIWRIPVAGGEPALMATYPFDMSLFFAGKVLSPDRSQVVYLQRTNPEANQWALHLARLDGAADANPRNGNLRFIAWSPDGRWMTIEQGGEYFIGDASGSFRSLAEVLPVIEMQWVDAQRFLYLSGDYENMQLQLGKLDAPSQSIGAAADEYILFNFSVGN